MYASQLYVCGGDGTHRAAQSIKSKVLTKPHTGRGEATSQRHLRGSKPCVAKRHRLGGLYVPTLAARVRVNPRLTRLDWSSSAR